jgi:hypothetical protein
MNRHKVLRTMVWTLALQAAIYVPWPFRPCAQGPPCQNPSPTVGTSWNGYQAATGGNRAGVGRVANPSGADAAATPFGTQIHGAAPGAYAVEYRKQGATIWMLYSAANEQIAVDTATSMPRDNPWDTPMETKLRLVIAEDETVTREMLARLLAWKTTSRSSGRHGTVIRRSA